jgi:hypothetical protein
MPECLSPWLNVEIADLDVSQASNIVLDGDGRSKLDHLLAAHSPQTKDCKNSKAADRSSERSKNCSKSK